MIVLTDDVESSSPNEHTPLKSPTGPPAQSPSISTPPPPYAPTSPISPIAPSPAAASWPRPGPPPTTPFAQPQRPRGDADSVNGRVLRRLFKAWLAAWAVIFLWGMFVGSVRVTISNFERDSPAGILHTWWQKGGLINFSLSGTPSKAGAPAEGQCSCSGDGSSTFTRFIPVPTATATLRPLPIDYPPLLKAAVVDLPEGQDKS